mmetsp:Transcript_18780/g.28540  ORF Transcript_18780/g.28540 Transcript_18780/m.28540 type:complete len:689 (-) Transcript_18780:23-2089(-)
MTNTEIDEPKLGSYEEEEGGELASSSIARISDSTFLSSALNNEDEDLNSDADDDMNMLLHKIDSNSKKRRKRRLMSMPSVFLQKRLITLRSLLLASSLGLTLMTFWLLDSLKDPTFAALVDGDLKRHQPLAKMASVGGTLILVVIMELVTHERKKRSRARQELKIRLAEDVQSGGGIWTKMDIGSTIDVLNDDMENDENGDLIPISIFRSVGMAYIVAFSVISIVLGRYHKFFNDEEYDNEHDHDDPQEDKKMAWLMLGYTQYIVIESFGSIGVATFWSFVNSTLTLKAAKTFYGFIIAMAQVGAIGGASLATLDIAIPKLFALSCLGIALQIGVMEIYRERFPLAMNEDDDAAIVSSADDHDFEAELASKAKKARQQQQKEQKSKPERQESDAAISSPRVFMSGVHLILKHNYLLLILGVSCLYEVSLTCLDYEMKLIGLDRFRAPPEFLEDNSVVDSSMSEEAASAFATFMGRYGQLTNFLSLLLSYYAFPYLMDNWGLKRTLRIFPSLLLLITVMTFVALPLNLPVLFISMSFLKALTYSINDPAKEILYIPTGNTVKFKAKFWIDVVGARIAKAVGSSINTYAGSAERIVQYGTLPSVVTAMALWVICFAAGNEFDSLLKRGEIVGIEEDEQIISTPLYYDNMEDDNEASESEDDRVNTLLESESLDRSESGWESNVSIELAKR